MCVYMSGCFCYIGFLNVTQSDRMLCVCVCCFGYFFI